MFAKYEWIRDPANPVLPPDPERPYESMRCMNPFAVRVGDEVRLYYSGGDPQGRQRICLAISPVERPTNFERQGVVLDIGAEGDFDARWCVLPRVYRLGGTWHLYYSGNDGTKRGLQSSPGIGLATSDDGLHFRKYSSGPVITGDQTAEFPHNRGTAGGSLLAEPQPDGSTRYRMYYTLSVGRKSPDVRIDQEKHCAVCHSADGICWTDHRVVMSPRRDVPKEDIAVAVPLVWRDGDLYRMLYSSIGTRWGGYSISEAFSADGYAWHRGLGDENLSLAPDPESDWESKMVEYPNIIEEPGRLRLFYCGNKYGATGIGTAVSLEA